MISQDEWYKLFPVTLSTITTTTTTTTTTTVTITSTRNPSSSSKCSYMGPTTRRSIRTTNSTRPITSSSTSITTSSIFSTTTTESTVTMPARNSLTDQTTSPQPQYGAEIDLPNLGVSMRLDGLGLFGALLLIIVLVAVAVMVKINGKRRQRSQLPNFKRLPAARQQLMPLSAMPRASAPPPPPPAIMPLPASAPQPTIMPLSEVSQSHSIMRMPRRTLPPFPEMPSFFSMKKKTGGLVHSNTFNNQC